jgi:riboflavin transporter 2
VFLTYIGKFKQNYVTALYIGEGISSLLPGVLAIAQGIGEDNTCSINLNASNISSTNNTIDNTQPNFSVSAYFWILFLILGISLGAFILLDRLSKFKKQRIKRNDEAQVEEPLKGKNVTDGKIYAVKLEIKRGKYYLYVSITIVSFLLYGFIPGLSSYSALPYSSKTMHLSISLALIVQPLSSVVATFIQLKSIRSIFIILLLGALISSYIIAMSFLSPCPILKDSVIGDVLMVKLLHV